MKNYRRMDDLGRVAIPKDIRTEAKVNEGDAFEVVVREDGVIELRPLTENQVNQFIENRK